MNYDTTTSSGAGTAGAVVGGLIGLAIYVVYVVGLWKMFAKAGYPGWLAIIPIVNTIFFIKCGNHSGWFVLLYLIPVVNVVVHAFVCLWVARAYGHGVGYAIGLFFLPFVFVLVLGFGSSQHHRTV